MRDEQRRRPFRAALANADFRRLTASMALSTAGDWLYNVALLVFVFEVTGSATWVAVATVMRLLPYVLFGALGGAVADRYDGRRVMIASDLLRAGLMAGLAFTAAAGGSAGVAVVFAFLTTTAGTAYLPSVVKGIPVMVGEHNLAAANAVRSIVDNVSVVVGPAVGGLVLLLGSPTWAFAGNAVTFLLSAAVLRRMRPLPSAAGPEEPTTLVQEVAAGWQVLRSSSAARWLTATQMMGAAMYGLHTVFLVLVADELIGVGSSGVGYLYAGLGAGGVAVVAVTTRLVDSALPSVWLLLGAAVSGFAFVVLATTGALAAALVVVAVQGAAWVLMDVIGMTMLQRTLEPDVLARVYGIADALVVLSLLAGSLLATLLANAASLRAGLVAGGLAFVVLAAVSLPRLLQLDRATMARRAELAPSVGILEGLAIFDGTSRRGLEALAAATVREQVAAGQAVVTEGEPATDFFVVIDGELDVLASGGLGGQQRKVNTLGRGDYFGEIGLLEQRPRTATVRSVGDVVVARIDGAAFLDAVRGDERAGTLLRQRMVARLRQTRAAPVPPVASA